MIDKMFASIKRRLQTRRDEKIAEARSAAIKAKELAITERQKCDRTWDATMKGSSVPNEIRAMFNIRFREVEQRMISALVNFAKAEKGGEQSVLLYNDFADTFGIIASGYVGIRGHLQRLLDGSMEPNS